MVKSRINFPYLELSVTDLNALLVFAKVVEANGFSAAARRLKMPVSTVSRRITELEDALGVRLLERSTRSLRLTDVGAEVFEQAQRGAEVGQAIDRIVSNQHATVAGALRLSVPPNLSDSLLAPLLGAFQEAYPAVRVQVFVTERAVDHIAEGIDLAFRIGALKDSSLTVRRLLTYRHQLVASPTYAARHPLPRTPAELLEHRLIAFSNWTPGRTWRFIHATTGEQQAINFQPHLATNDYSGVAAILLTGAGIGDLPPVVAPELMRSGQLVEIMPDWHFPTFDMSLVHLGNRHVPRPVRAFKDFATRLAPTLFPDLPV